MVEASRVADQPVEGPVFRMLLLQHKGHENRNRGPCRPSLATLHTVEFISSGSIALESQGFFFRSYVNVTNLHNRAAEAF